MQVMVQNQRGFLNSAEITKIIAPIPLKKRKSWRDSKRLCIAKGKPLVQKKRKERNLDKNQNIQGEKKEKKKKTIGKSQNIHCLEVIVVFTKLLSDHIKYSSQVQKKIASFSKEYSQGCFHYMSYLSTTKSQQDGTWTGITASKLYYIPPALFTPNGQKVSFGHHFFFSGCTEAFWPWKGSGSEQSV